MNALVFLVRKQIKNFFRELVHHPSKLVLYLVMAAFLVLGLVAGQKEPAKAAQYSDFRILHGIFLAWLLFLTVPTIFGSLKSGTTMFKMSDVNFLFVSPISPKSILNYGVMKQTASTLFGFIFLLFCSGSLMSNFRISFLGVIWLVLGSVMIVVVMQVISLLAYSLSNGDAKRQNVVRIVLYVYLGALALTVLFLFQKNGGGLEAFYAAIASPYLEYFPVVGWTKGAVFGFITGDARAAAVYLLLLAAAFFLCFLLFKRSDADYYEDVLQSTETMFEARQAMKEKRGATVRSGRKVRVGKTGLGGGWGASTFFYKHLCEARRRSRLVFISVSTVVMLLCDIALTYFVSSVERSDSGGAILPDHLMLIAFAADLYILFLMNAAGDWSRELTKPYIYLVPADPFRKLIWASMTSVIKPFVDGAVFFFVLCAVVHANLLTALVCFLAYGSFGLLFLSGNVLGQRTMGSMANRGLFMMLYMLLLLLLMAPGIGGSVAVYMTLKSGPAAFLLFLSGLPMVGWNVIVSLVILFCCRNLLSDTEAA
jgi:hypothetical protein